MVFLFPRKSETPSGRWLSRVSHPSPKAWASCFLGRAAPATLRLPKPFGDKFSLKMFETGFPGYINERRGETKRLRLAAKELGKAGEAGENKTRRSLLFLFQRNPCFSRMKLLALPHEPPEPEGMGFLFPRKSGPRPPPPAKSLRQPNI